MTFQAPMSANTDYDASAQFVKLAYEALGADRTQAIALGNEVENYAHTPEAYNDMAKKLEDKIISVLGLKGDQTRIFEVLDLGSGSMTALRLNETNKAWPLSAAFQAGLNSNNNVKQAAAHWYQIEGHEGPHNLQDSLMSHTTITTKSRPYITATRYLHQHSPSIPFILTETAGQIGSGVPDLGPTFGPTFGSTLWSVDWQLYCMSRGIARIAATMRPNAPHSLWIPDANVEAQGQHGQAVRAPYYAQVFVADFLGTTEKGASVLEWEGQRDRFTAYGAYEAEKLVRIGVVDLREWSERNGTRPVRKVRIPVPVGRDQSVRAARLAAELGAYSGGLDFNGMNITYAGQQWSKKVDDGVGHPDKPVFEMPRVEVRASEAVIVHLD